MRTNKCITDDVCFLHDAYQPCLYMQCAMNLLDVSWIAAN